MYDGEDVDASLLLQHCGSSLPQPTLLQSTGSSLTVRLKADGQIPSKGFTASYKRVMSSSTVIIHSYNMKYIPRSNFFFSLIWSLFLRTLRKTCCYRMIIISGLALPSFLLGSYHSYNFSLTLCFTLFTTLSSSFSKCYPLVDIASIILLCIPFIVWFCIFSKLNYMYIIVGSFNHFICNFFILTYFSKSDIKTNSLQGCGASIAVAADGSGEIKSPNFPNYYISGLNCSWHLNAPEG